jgi:hypothetical protein
MLGLGERKGEKRVWDASWWWLGFSGVVVVVGRRGGKNEEKMAHGGFYFGLIFLSFGLIFVWFSYNQMGVCSAIEIMG